MRWREGAFKELDKRAWKNFVFQASAYDFTVTIGSTVLPFCSLSLFSLNVHKVAIEAIATVEAKSIVIIKLCRVPNESLFLIH